jgi:hypothetical protein
VTVALLALGTTVASAVGTPGERRAGGQSVEVVGATAVCPDLRQISGSATRVSVGSAPLPEGRTATGGAVVAHSVAGRPQDIALPLTAPGEVATDLGGAVDKNALAVAATGALAVGLEVEQVTRGEAAAYAWRGFSGLRCEPPSREGWFVGGSTKVGDASWLVLVNVEDSPATVDVSVLTPQGPADARAGQGITVPPQSRVELPLDALAPDVGYLAVHVLTRRGRVAMSVRHHRYSYPVPRGVDYVPESVPPATTVTVPGFPQGEGARLLLLANPTQDDTTVSLRVTTAGEQFVPTGMDQVKVPAGSTATVTLSALTATTPLAVQVTSSGAPVLASGLVVDSQQTKVEDISYTTGSPALTGDALLTDLVIDRPTESTLLLTAPDEAAQVVVRPIKVVGTVGPLPGPRTVSIPAGRTVTFRLSTFFPPGTATRLAVEVQPTPGSGPVYAARYLRARGAHGPLTTLLDLQGPAQRVPRPEVVQDAEAGYR